MKRRRPRTEDFTLGWICPLPLEYAAAKSVLDELYEESEYATGRIHNHDIVITCLPAGQMGTNAAAAAASRMLSSFPSLKAALLVGIGGGVPSDKADIRLGDVVVGQPEREFGGVVQYDFGKTITGGFQRIGSLNAPSHALLMAVSKFKSNLTTTRNNIRKYLVERPASSADVLFESSYDHAGGDTCSDCNTERVVERRHRDEDIGVFFGTIGSGNQVIKDGITRDKINSTLGGVLCFEMEAAGVANLLHCLVIRGICDYADSHKSKVFQPFAAAAAAACAREILTYLPSTSNMSHQEEENSVVEKPQGLSPSQQKTYHDSLRFAQLDNRYRTIKMAHVKTCRWLLTCSEYKNWLDPKCFNQHHGFFWIKGKPGAGKSTIMKFAFIQANRKMTNTTVLPFFFDARGDILEKTAIGVYRSLLWQLFDRLPDLLGVFNTLPTTPTPGQAANWDVETLKYLISMAVEELQNRRLICYIDALDECDEAEVRDMVSFFEQLGDLAVSAQVQLLVCFSSRHYPHITIEHKIELVLENHRGHGQDIFNYVNCELKTGRSEQIQEIKKDIINRSSGVFLWAVLVVQILNKEYDRGQVHALQRRLSQIPDKLHLLLKDILTRDNHNMNNTLLCLRWILYAKRPLTGKEVYCAILSGVESEGFLTAWTMTEVDEENVNKFVLDASKGLAEMTKSDSPTVRFIHESVRDFLRHEGFIDLNVGSIAQGPSHDALKNCCLNYLNIDLSPCLHRLSSVDGNPVERVPQLYPFLEYALQNVFYHANVAAEHAITQTTFLTDFPLAGWIFKCNVLMGRSCYTRSADLIYILAEKDCAKLLETVIRMGYTVRKPTERYGHPLRAAVVLGNEKSAGILLKMEASVKEVLNKRCIDGGTLLSFASEKGLGTVVRLLVERGAELSCRANEGCTPLHLAACRRHTEVMKLLLDGGADPQSRDDLDRTPLSRAITEGIGSSPEVMIVLLDRGADLEAKDFSGKTPLSLAIQRKREDLVALLLNRGASPLSADMFGITPVDYAKLGESPRIAELLEKAVETP